MKLLVAIVLSTLVGFLLMLLGPLFGGFLAFGIILGILVRGLILLSEIHKLIMVKEPKSALDVYLEERDRKENALNFRS